MEPIQDELISSEPIQSPSNWAWLSFCVAGIIFVSSFIIAFSISNRIDSSNRSSLLTRVQTVSYLSDTENIAKLAGDTSDLYSLSYQSVKSSLYGLRDINSDTRFMYIMRSNGTKLFFLADSEQPTSKDYSPPGQVYEETSSIEMSNYDKQVAFTEGPYTDEWGTWISAYSPIYTKDGSYVGIFGMDVNYANWKRELLLVTAMICVAGIIISGMFFLLGLYLRRVFTMVAGVNRMNTYLLYQKERAEQVASRASIGEWTLSPRLGSLIFNDAMYELTQISKQEKLNLEAFTGLMVHESKMAFDRAFEDAVIKNENEFSCEVKLITDKKLKLSGTISYGSGVTPVRVTGIAQKI